LAKCAEVVRQDGGRLWAAFATHGLFVGDVNENLSKIDRIITTDTIVPSKINEEIRSKLHIISTAKIFAQAIRRIHDQGGSISELLK
jgi:ribose-phosphate pyrophosphokinase